MESKMAAKIKDGRQQYQKYLFFAPAFIHIAMHVEVESKAYVLFKGLYVYF